MTCIQCAAELADGAVFCSTCGTPQINDPGAATITIKLPDDPVLAQLRKELAGDYEVEKELGRGGMAVVYKAVEVQLQRTVALKVVPPENSGGTTTAERFKREARMAASLDHANIIPVYRVAQAGNLLYMSMKFVEGRALDAIIEQQGPLPIPVVLEVLRCSAHALAYAHEHGIVHRDIKGANILIDKDGRVVVSDFGIARAVEEKSMTASGMIIGTPYFMSPEQCGGLKVGPQSDQYSLGIMAFQMLTGEVPFDADSVMGIIQHHYMTPVPDIRQVRDDVPTELLNAIYRALNKDVADRYEQTSLLADALDAVPDPEGLSRRDAQQMLRALTAGEAVPKIRTASLPPLAPTGVMPRPASMPHIPTVVKKAPPKSKAPLFAGIGVGAVAVAAGLYFTVLKPKDGAVAPVGSAGAAAIEPDSGGVKFTGLPDGARISIDSKDIDGTQARLPKGQYPYRITATGYLPEQSAFTIVGGKDVDIPVTMRKDLAAAQAALAAKQQSRPQPTGGSAPPPQQSAPAANGTISVGTDVTIADITIDGVSIGKGRAFNVSTRSGTHTLRISADGYEPYSQSITIPANGPLSLGKISLKPKGGE